MKLLFLLVFFICAPILLAQNTQKEPSPEILREFILKKTGGVVTKQHLGKKILIKNMQNVVPHAVVTNTFIPFIETIRLPFCSDILPNPPSNISPLSLVPPISKSTESTCTIVLVDMLDWPMLLVAPEAGWAIANVAPLREGTDQKKVERRTQQILCRSLCYALGGGDSDVEKCVMSSVVSASDLDKLNTVPYPNYLNKMSRRSKLIGISPLHTTTYRKAMEEGWAPPPKDKYQQAIWDELKADKKE